MTVPDADTVRTHATVTGIVLIQLLANGIGVAIVIVFLRWLFPVIVEPGEEVARLNAVLFGGYVALNVLLALPINALLVRRALRWARLGIEPNLIERIATFRLPLFETFSAFLGWIVGAAIFGLRYPNAQRVAVGIGLAGLVVCSLLYLMIERHLRPVFAIATRGIELPERRTEIMPRLMLAWLLGSVVPLVAVALGPIAFPTAQLDRNRQIALLLIALIGGGLVMFGAARSVAAPINRVRKSLLAVAKGNLAVELPVDNLGEIGRLSSGFNDLVDAMKERDAIADQFQRQVGLRADESIEARHGDGDERDLTVMFCDLTGYTAFTEHHRASEVVDLLNRFFDLAVTITGRHGGWVNKFEGDAILAVFGAPEVLGDHAASALAAAEEIHATLSRRDDVLPVGIGVATGRALAVNIGTADRFEYTVIGDVVNLAARLCELAKTESPPVLTTERTLDAAGRPPGWVTSEAISVRGRSEPVVVVRLEDSGRPFPSGHLP